MIVWLLILAALGGLMHAARSFGADPNSGTLLAFGYFMLASFFTGKIASKIGLPKLTGYLLVGVICGPYVLDLVRAQTAAHLQVVSDSAICLIALTAGSELSFARLRPIMPVLRAMTLYAVVGAAAVLAAVLFAMHAWIPFLADLPADQALAVSAVIGVALSAQSPAVVIALLAETRADGPVSRVILGSVVLADLVVITMYAIAATVATSALGGGLDVTDTALAVSWQLFGSIAFGIAMGMTIGGYLRWVQRNGVLFAVLCCVVVAEIGPRARLDPLIVMLAAGIWLENASRASAHDLLREIESGRLPLFLVFFALAGTHIDLGRLVASIVPVGVLVIARVVAFRFGAGVACRRSAAPPAVARYAWFGLVPQSGLAIALALLVEQTFPSFGNAAAVLVFGVVGVNELIAPVILRAMLVRSGEAGARPASEATPVDH